MVHQKHSQNLQNNAQVAQQTCLLNETTTATMRQRQNLQNLPNQHSNTIGTQRAYFLKEASTMRLQKVAAQNQPNLEHKAGATQQACSFKTLMPKPSLEAGDERMNDNLELVLDCGQRTLHGNPIAFRSSVSNANVGASSTSIATELRSRLISSRIEPSTPGHGVGVVDPPMKNQFHIPDEMANNSPFSRCIVEDDCLIIYCDGGDST
jgi:hypothetical protein